MLPRRRANKSQLATLRHFSHWPRRIYGRGGAAGSKWSSVQPEARPGGPVQEGEEGKKGRRELLEKHRETSCVFIHGELSGWQMRSGSTPCRTRRAVRRSRGH
jgi:hypothetical protein